MFCGLLLSKDILRVVAGGWEEGEMGSCGLMSLEFQFRKMKSSGDWLHNCVSVLNAAELYTQK